MDRGLNVRSGTPAIHRVRTMLATDDRLDCARPARLALENLSKSHAELVDVVDTRYIINVLHGLLDQAHTELDTRHADLNMLKQSLEDHLAFPPEILDGVTATVELESGAVSKSHSGRYVFP